MGATACMWWDSHDNLNDEAYNQVLVPRRLFNSTVTPTRWRYGVNQPAADPYCSRLWPMEAEHFLPSSKQLSPVLASFHRSINIMSVFQRYGVGGWSEKENRLTIGPQIAFVFRNCRADKVSLIVSLVSFLQFLIFLPPSCSSAADTLACLRTVDIDTLQAANININLSGFFGTFVFVPVVDGVFIRDQPTEILRSGRVNGVRGINSYASLNSNKNILTMAMVWCILGNPVFSYKLEWREYFYRSGHSKYGSSCGLRDSALPRDFRKRRAGCCSTICRAREQYLPGNRNHGRM